MKRSLAPEEEACWEPGAPARVSAVAVVAVAVVVAAVASFETA